jgi:GxxExxY protein
MKTKIPTEQGNESHLSGIVICAAMKVHSALGPGLLESTYQACLFHELRDMGLEVKGHVELPVVYRGTRIDLGYRIDLLVEEALVVELKAVERVRAIHRAQIFSYLKLSGIRLGLLINFNSVHLKDGIHRIINGY